MRGCKGKQMYQILKLIIKTGIRSETPAQTDETLRHVAQRLKQEILDAFGWALAIRQVDPGSCNDCELDSHAVSNAYYNIEGLGIKFVASPRHAALQLVTDSVSRHMEIALKRTCDVTPELETCSFDQRLCLRWRHIRRELRYLRQGLQCHPRGCRGKRLRTQAHCHSARYSDHCQCGKIMFFNPSQSRKGRIYLYSSATS